MIAFQTRDRKNGTITRTVHFDPITQKGTVMYSTPDNPMGLYSIKELLYYIGLWNTECGQDIVHVTERY